MSKESMVKVEVPDDDYFTLGIVGEKGQESLLRTVESLIGRVVAAVSHEEATAEKVRSHTSLSGEQFRFLPGHGAITLEPQSQSCRYQRHRDLPDISVRKYAASLALWQSDGGIPARLMASYTLSSEYFESWDVNIKGDPFNGNGQKSGPKVPEQLTANDVTHGRVNGPEQMLEALMMRDLTYLLNDPEGMRVNHPTNHPQVPMR